MKPLLGILVPVALAAIGGACSTASDTARVRDFIRTSWDDAVRFNPCDEGTLIGLPHPYTVPCVDGTFQELYYWDTYFTNEGLIRDGRTELAKNNVDDMLHLVERYGYMPNGNRTWYLDRSQPPYLAMAAARIFETTGDREWLASAFGTLRREYDFWMRERSTPAGLNRYSSSAGEALRREFVRTGGTRLGTDFEALCRSEESLLRLGGHFAAEAESGWDFNPRFERRCEDFCPIDLNANLYLYERLFARFAEVLGDDAAAADWSRRAARRRDAIDRLCRADDGLYYDYDYRSNRRSTVLSGAVFNLLYAGIPDAEQAARLVAAALPRLEHAHGVAVTEDAPYDYSYQWAYPNCWAPIVYLAVRGLDAYGYRDQARRIARKYVATVVATFDATGNLWEKYDVRDGSIGVSDEYELPAMLGWSAGTFVYACDYLDGKIHEKPLKL